MTFQVVARKEQALYALSMPFLLQVKYNFLTQTWKYAGMGLQFYTPSKAGTDKL